MFKLFKENFKRTNDCIILAVPLIIFLSIVSWYCLFVQYHANDVFQLLFGFLTVIVMFAGFSSLWFYLTKKIIKLSGLVFVFDRDRINALKDLVRSLPKGLGKLFLSMLAGTVFILIIAGLIFFISYFVTTKFVGPIDYSLFLDMDVFVSSSELVSIVSELPNEMLISINFFLFVFYSLSLVFAFLGMLWLPEVVYSYTNPFKAIIISLQKLFSKFWKSLFLFFLISLMYVAITIINTILMMNIYLYFLVLVLSYYFLIFVIVLIFSYYEQEFKN